MNLRISRAYDEEIVDSMKKSFHDFYEQKSSFYSFDFPLTIEWGESGHEQKYPTEPLRYVLYDGENPIGLFQGIVQKRFLISSLVAGSTSGNGIIVYPTYGTKALRFFVSAVLEKEKFSSTSIFAPNDVRVPDLLVKKHYTAHIDLTEPMENIMSKMTKECRWAIRKAETNRVQIEISNSDNLLKEVYSIVSKTANAKNVAVPSIRLILDLHARFKKFGLSVSAIARHNGKSVSAGYFLGYDKKLNWFIGGSKPEGYELQAGNLVQMKAIEWAKNHGCKIYDVGGTHPTDLRYARIHKFKSSFGGCLVTNYVLFRNEYYMPFLMKVKSLIDRWHERSLSITGF